MSKEGRRHIVLNSHGKGEPKILWDEGCEDYKLTECKPAIWHAIVEILASDTSQYPHSVDELVLCMLDRSINILFVLLIMFNVLRCVYSFFTRDATQSALCHGNSSVHR